MATACVVQAGCLYEVEAPDLEGRDVRLTILHTSDIHSRIFPYDHDPLFTEMELGLEPDRGPYGGIARIAHIVKRERKKAGRSLYVDSGDLFQGAPVFNLFDGEVEIRALSRAGIDVMALGNHEFDAGPANVAQKFGDWADFPVLAANYEFERGSQPFAEDFDILVHPFTIYNVDGLQIAIIGMGNLSSMHSLEDGGNKLGIVPLETIQTVQYYVNLLRDEVDLVFLLGHLGLGEDEYIGRNVCGLDLILGGHHHIALDPPKTIRYDPDPELIAGVGEIEDEDNNVEPGIPQGEDGGPEIKGLGECPPEMRRDVLLTHPNAFAKFVGRLDLVVRDGRIRAHKHRLFPVDNTVPEDPETRFVLEEYLEEMDRTLDLSRVMTNADTRIRRFGASGGDSMLGNFVAEAMQFRSFVETDFCVTNSLGIRTDILEGPITLEQLYNVLPFENTIATLFMSGIEVQELLDFATQRSASRGCNSQVQVSGVTFTMNCRTGEAEDILIGGNSLEVDAVYELCTNNFIADGGSGFKVLQRNTTTIDTGISMRDAVIDYMEQSDSLPVCFDENNQDLDVCAAGLAIEDGRIQTRF